ncbi:uncharacterized protein AMSG_07546 [Thecamonas trahens ATCC 50062]|uniref:LIM zinc-binding domain-containing protein n=1 Tax=Thecamonas trahens ATCC 50062 TaxID=461836 RepID=A0A0L0DH46_THETB|nr:hypothetical protein AMSG_07546 [Thecamonas trahens ATCC 50062]KNC51632.1 hypothetical protein AMSG_07546 [Thecamonas trahens ATCC 50062]|eukprot:XP_013756027.1 hypothetical protein AMSG_07546 [Thecamonas trahens ATCC 50062]
MGPFSNGSFVLTATTQPSSSNSPCTAVDADGRRPVCRTCASGSGPAVSKATLASPAERAGSYCHGCGSLLGKGTLVATPSGKFHAACFTCDSCAIALTGDYMVSESGSPLCGNCADMIRGESGEEPGSPCMICGESIVEGTIVKAMGGVIHGACWRCASCDAPITGQFGRGKAGTAVEGKPICPPCAGHPSQLPAEA